VFVLFEYNKIEAKKKTYQHKIGVET